MGTAPPVPLFKRGDGDSNGRVEITDAIAILSLLFLGGPPPACPDAADTDDSGSLDITDAVVILSYQFLGGPPPPAPGPETCGVDALPEDPDLGCVEGCP